MYTKNPIDGVNRMIQLEKELKNWKVRVRNYYRCEETVLKKN